MKLKELRKTTGLNQTETAQRIGIPRTSYNGYELGQVEPDIQTLCRIADYYGVTLDYLCEHETKQLDISYYSPKAIELVKKLPLLNNSNLLKLDNVCDGLILAQ